MDTLKKGDIVKLKANGQEMVINRKYLDRHKFNSGVIGYLMDDKDLGEEKMWIYVCFVEENGIVKKREFKRHELILITPAP